MTTTYTHLWGICMYLGNQRVHVSMINAYTSWQLLRTCLRNWHLCVSKIDTYDVYASQQLTRIHVLQRLPHTCLNNCCVCSLNLISCDIIWDWIGSDIMRNKSKLDLIWYHLISDCTGSDLISPIFSDIMWHQMYQIHSDTMWCQIDMISD